MACGTVNLQTKCTCCPTCTCANALKPLPDLLVRLKELGYASVDADALAFIEVPLRIARADTLGVACPKKYG
jgi:hypothetical protein